MGWRFRRSISIGRLFRINLSKNGVGMSMGVPGFRIGIGADGKIRRTVGLPGSGLYKTDVIGTSKPSTRSCPRCGSRVAAKNKFCPNCGLKL